MNRSLLASVMLFALACDAGPTFDVAEATSALSASERRDRAALIRDLYAEQGITSAWLAAGLADAETMMTQCRTGETPYWERNGCSGPHSDYCGGPVLAGAGDGPCSARQGGLGMFQFDGGDFDDTLARDGRHVLDLDGNVRQSIVFVLDMIRRSPYTRGIRTREDAVRWMNAIDSPAHPEFDNWVKTVTHLYNGCRPGWTCWTERHGRYRDFARNMHGEMGASFWRAGAPAGAIDEGTVDPRVPPPVPSGPTVADGVRENRGSCSTVGFERLSRQLAQHQACLFPGQFVEVRHPNVRATSGRVHLFMVPESAAALGRVADSTPLSINSAFRPVSDQIALVRRGGCGAAAAPGRSNHQGGRAVDVDNWSSVRSAMSRGGFRWYGAGDEVHFDGPGPDQRARSVLAFQSLWNLNHPEDPIAEDGAYGPQTEARLLRTPMAGFSRTSCGGATPEPAPGEPTPMPVDPAVCGDLIPCLEGLGGLACFDDHPTVLDCGHHGGGAACFESCGGAPEVCPEAITCWRSGGGGACFRPERCDAATESVEPPACGDYRLASPEMGLRTLAFTLACASNEAEVARIHREGTGAILQLAPEHAASLAALTPGHGRVDHVYVRGGGTDEPLVVFVFASSYSGMIESDGPWSTSGRAALGYALDALPQPHLETLAGVVVDLVRGGSSVRWRLPTPFGESELDERVADATSRGVARVATDPAGYAMVFTDAALASRGIGALELARELGAQMEVASHGTGASAFPTEMSGLGFESCRVLDVAVPFCTTASGEAEDYLGRSGEGGPLGFVGTLYQHAVGASEVLREDATYQRGAPHEALYGAAGSAAVGVQGAAACSRWALCGNEPSDADRDGVTWLPTEVSERRTSSGETVETSDCSDLNPANVDGSCTPSEEDPCAVHTTCGACNEAVGCGFCAASGECGSDRHRASCEGDWQGSPSACVDCTALSECGACVANGFCGWCPGMGCLNDHSEAAIACGEAYEIQRCGG
ncbi:MAG: hypothetical protein H6722_00440 [Sandaracinus sp.]|nr:hypothetical protein [Sandaracinus sp.]MCB9621521.1 hypothetical protein [Sandaracinus sp.]